MKEYMDDRIRFPLETPPGLVDTPDNAQATSKSNRLMDLAAHRNLILNMGVDIVFVIDCTKSMQMLIDTVKQIAMDFRTKLDVELEKRGRRIAKLRVKVIGFRDFYADEEPYGPLQESGFFTLPAQQDEFDIFVGSLEDHGGGDDPESALEALHFAINSEWDRDESVHKRVQLIMGFTDNAAHPLDHALRGEPEANQLYPAQMPEDMKALEGEWNDGECIDQTAKRMFWFAPKVWPWTEDAIGRWNGVELKDSGIELGSGLTEVSLTEIMNQIVNSVRQ